jgi:hypothetical protein
LVSDKLAQLKKLLPNLIKIIKCAEDETNEKENKCNLTNMHLFIFESAQRADFCRAILA